jgi:hypothetical protein
VYGAMKAVPRVRQVCRKVQRGKLVIFATSYAFGQSGSRLVGRPSGNWPERLSGKPVRSGPIRDTIGMYLAPFHIGLANRGH